MAKNRFRWRYGLWVLGAAAVVLGAGTLVAGCLAAPGFAGGKMDNFDGERFVNRVPVPEKTFGDVLGWWMDRDRGPWEERFDEAPGERPLAAVSESGELRVTMINHSTLLLQLDGLNILTDPVYSKRVGPFSWVGPKRHRHPGVRFEDLPKIHAVLVSHNHYDHFDLPTLRRLAEAHQPRIIVPLGNKALLERHDIPGGEEYNWGQSTRLSEEVEVTLLTARHWSGRGLDDRYRTLWGAYVVEGSGGPVYFAGDTGWGPHFAEARRRFGPMRLALLPIGAYKPRHFMEAAHISPDEAVQAHIALGASTSVAMHYGTFSLGDDGMDEPVRDLQRAVAARADALGGSRFWVLEHGVGRTVPRPAAADSALARQNPRGETARPAGSPAPALRTAADSTAEEGAPCASTPPLTVTHSAACALPK